jgi:hypothetical protein
VAGGEEGRVVEEGAVVDDGQVRMIVGAGRQDAA